MIKAQSTIDASPLIPFHRKLVLQSAGGPFLDGWLLSILGIALVGMSVDLRMSSLQVSWTGAASLIGIFFGGAIFGRVTDRIGRQLMYTVDLVVLVVASALCAFVTEPWHVIALRLLIGVAIGADYPIATALLTEWLPVKRRGALIGVVAVAWFVGAAAATLVGFALSAWLGDGGWRIMLASSLVPGLIILLLRIGTPESPRWLASKGRLEEAREVTRKVLGRDVDPAELVESSGNNGQESRVGLRAVLHGEYLRRIFFCGFTYLALSTPIFAMYTFGPQILKSFGMDSGNMSNLGSTIINVLFLVGCLPALRWIESSGRRPLLLWSFAAMAIPMAILGVIPSASVGVVIAAFAVYALASGGPNLLVWTYPNEIFPTEIRATAMGLVTAISRIGAAAGTFLLPIGLDKWGDGPVMLCAAGLTIAGLLVSFAMAPETRGRTLAETSSTTNESQSAVPDRVEPMIQ